MITQRAALINEVPQGAYIMNVVDGSPAGNAGLEADDIVTKIDGESLSEENQLSDVIAAKKVGDSLRLEVWRDGETQTLTVTLSDFEN